MTTALGQLTTLDAARAKVLVVPVGSCEQHGPHLPLSTDTVVAEALVAGLGEQIDGLVTSPTIAISASGEHEGFPGTLSIGTEVLAQVLIELVRSARRTVDAVVVVSGHGGNADALSKLATVAGFEGDHVLVHLPRLDGDAHAGRTETSLMLHLAPHLVDLGRAEVGVTTPVGELADALRQGGVASVTPNGVLGDPTGASAEEGARLYEQMRQDLTVAIQHFLEALS